MVLDITDQNCTSKKVREDYHDIPWLNLAFDGSKDASALTRLETFIFQAKQYQEQKWGKE